MKGIIFAINSLFQVYPYFGVDADHAGVVELYDKVAKNGYQLIYLTARSMGDDQDTRKYLFKVGCYKTASLLILCQQETHSRVLFRILLTFP